MLEALCGCLVFAAQACALGPTHLIHRLIQMTRDMETIEHVQSLAGLVAQKQFRRITGYKQIPALTRELETLAPSKKAVVKARKAS
jgi:hypothetical protein